MVLLLVYVPNEERGERVLLRQKERKLGTEVHCGSYHHSGSDQCDLSRAYAASPVAVVRSDWLI